VEVAPCNLSAPLLKTLMNFADTGVYSSVPGVWSAIATFHISSRLASLEGRSCQLMQITSNSRLALETEWRIEERS
jgi:hypothetical protein